MNDDLGTESAGKSHQNTESTRSPCDYLVSVKVLNLGQKEGHK